MSVQMKFPLYILVSILMSFFLFPISFTFLPSVNTKMIMAVLGVLAYVLESIASRNAYLYRGLIYVFLLALSVSLCGLLSVIVNETSDFEYGTYVISFFVWTFAAYFVVWLIKTVHGEATVELVCDYLISVAVWQCAIAIVIDQIPTIKNAVNSVVVGFGSMFSAGEGLERAGRLYGIGTALDVAGTRFCAIISIIGIQLYEYFLKGRALRVIIYAISFFFVLVVGSMMSRTTMVGVIFFLLFLFFIVRQKRARFSFWFLFLTAIVFLICLLLYWRGGFFVDKIRFAFEGFFNLVETGRWSTTSTGELQDMYIFPENFSTWLIGDGYFMEPSLFDPNYIGDVSSWGMFYMGTDVGYLRFIYYFGLPGLLAFMLYFVLCTFLCTSEIPQHKWVFVACLMMQLIIWFKVATDIFCIFALFLCVIQLSSAEQQKDGLI